MKNYIHNIENSKAFKLTEEKYSCDIHGDGVATVRTFVNKPRTFTHTEWIKWQYPQKGELCPKCRAKINSERALAREKERQKQWFESLSFEQQQAIREGKGT